MNRSIFMNIQRRCAADEPKTGNIRAEELKCSDIIHNYIYSYMT